MNPLSVMLSFLVYQFASARRSMSGDEMNSMFRSRRINRKLILDAMRPYHGANMERRRRAKEADDQQNYVDENLYGLLGSRGITGDYSVHFNSCVSLSMQEDWEALDNFESISGLVENGQIKSVRNYVLFNVCETLDGCSNGRASEENTYMVDLNTWVLAMIDYLPEQKDYYCEGCWNQYDYCMNFFVNATDEELNFDYTSAAFFYDEIRFQIIDCNQCSAYDCYDENGDAYEQNNWDGLSNWVYELAQCQETGSQWNGTDLSAGFMCNQYGTGLEIGMFMDEDCTLYNSQTSYQQELDNDADDLAYYSKSQRVINYLFTYMFDCYGDEEIYVNIFQQEYFGDNSLRYDPCKIDEDSGEYYDDEACQEILETNPCYIVYDGDGKQKEVNEEECAAFMEDYPCWTMPGDEVSANYTDACNEFEASFSHQPNAACLGLFGMFGYGDGNEENDYQNQQQWQEDDQDRFFATALSACGYAIKNGYEIENLNGEQNANDREREDYNGFATGDWTSSLYYDISYNETRSPTSICAYMDTLFKKSQHLNHQVYDSSVSGNMYDYSDLGSENYSNNIQSSSSTSSSSSSSSSGGGSSSSSKDTSVYFPTRNSNTASKNYKQAGLSTPMIAMIAVVATFGALILAYGIMKCVHEDDDRDFVYVIEKDVPLMPEKKDLPIII